MGIMTHIGRWFGYGGAISQRNGDQISQPTMTVYEDTPMVGADGALQIAAVWACVDLYVKTIGSLPVMVYRNLANGMREIERDSVLWMLLHDAPNAWQTSQEFFEYMTLNRVLRGNAYARISRNASGQAIALWPVSADQMRPRLLPGGVLKYVWTSNGTESLLDASEVLHWRGMGNDLIGLSALDYMRSSLGVSIGAQNHTSRQYQNGGKPAGVMTIEKVLSKEQRTQIREAFDGVATGPAQNLYILEAGMKYQQISLSSADLQLLETRRFSVEDIARWFGVPSVLINDTAKTTTWGTGVEQLIEGFFKFAIRPELVRIEQAIKRRVMTPAQRSTSTVEFNFEGLLRTSLGVRMEAYAKGTQNGIYTSNECRQLENMPPMAGGDTLRAQTNLAPLDMLGKTEGVKDATAQTLAA